MYHVRPLQVYLTNTMPTPDRLVASESLHLVVETLRRGWRSWIIGKTCVQTADLHASRPLILKIVNIWNTDVAGRQAAARPLGRPPEPAAQLTVRPARSWPSAWPAAWLAAQRAA